MAGTRWCVGSAVGYGYTSQRPSHLPYRRKENAVASNPAHLAVCAVCRQAQKAAYLRTLASQIDRVTWQVLVLAEALVLAHTEPEAT